MPSAPRIVRLKDVLKLTGLGRTTLWRLEKEGRFPPRVRLSLRAVGWLRHDVVAWLDACRSGTRGGAV